MISSEMRGRSKQRALLVVAAAVSLLVLIAPPGGGAAPPSLKNPNGIACPSAPSGWNTPPPSKKLLTPESIPAPSELEHWAQGGNMVTATCTYHHSPAKAVSVILSYALPTDPNPYADFDLGCGTGGAPWDTSNRVYRVASVQEWAIATLDDPSAFLPAASVPQFEQVTRQLLSNAAGYGHPCSLVTKPTALASQIYFDVLVAGAHVKDTFFVSQQPNKDGSLPVTRIGPLTAPFHVQVGGHSRLLSVKLTRGIDYVVPRGKVAGRVRYDVKVRASQVPGCRRGATGMLVISTSTPRALLTVCGQTFLKNVDVEAVDFSNN